MLFDAALAEGFKIIQELIPDKDEQDKRKAEYQTALLAAETQLAIAQTEVNKVEAASDDNFTRRWRPFCGWICSVALAYHFILQPFLAFTFSAFNHPIALPIFDMDSLYTILLGMLGLGGYRTAEKIKGVAPK